ncbi:unnamed protein product [Moneuplotes crassus]|uniref:Uncharacterized protein n=1 Tax=Euplotes crassus TaxID=5936 RepID=A0AAD1Y2R7_EUPCR|nr:unnamed protein product [Moneuplotes crassus]
MQNFSRRDYRRTAQSSLQISRNHNLGTQAQNRLTTVGARKPQRGKSVMNHAIQGSFDERDLRDIQGKNYAKSSLMKTKSSKKRKKDYLALLKVIQKSSEADKYLESLDYVTVKSATWARDSFCLFDFESRHYIHSEFYFKNSGFLGITDSDHIQFMLSKSQEVNQNSVESMDPENRSLKALVSIIKFRDKYYCFSSDRSPDSKKKQLWRVATRSPSNSTAPSGILLKKGMQVRFGKIQYKIKYISTIPNKDIPKNKLKKSKTKIVPINDPDRENLHHGDEESKMMQESLANNSAMAITFDHELNTNRSSHQKTQPNLNRGFEEEHKSGNTPNDLYRLNEAKPKDLELSIDHTNIPPVEIDNFIPLKADCRICLQEGQIISQEDQDPLDESILVCTPCNCQGYIHVECLRQWLKVHRKVVYSSEVCTSYIWDNIRCEICRNPYPDYIYCSLKDPRKYKKVRLLDLEDIEMVDDNRIVNIEIEDLKNLAPLENNQPYDYLILEGYKSIKEDFDIKIRKYIHVIKFTKKLTYAKIGRGSEANMRIIHSTVSRVHGVISYRNSQMHIRDLGSKFGTLVLCNKPFELKPDIENYIQVGRTLMNITLIKHRWHCCASTRKGILRGFHYYQYLKMAKNVKEFPPQYLDVIDEDFNLLDALKAQEDTENNKTNDKRSETDKIELTKSQLLNNRDIMESVMSEVKLKKKLRPKIAEPVRSISRSYSQVSRMAANRSSSHSVSPGLATITESNIARLNSNMRRVNPIIYRNGSSIQSFSDEEADEESPVYTFQP